MIQSDQARIIREAESVAHVTNSCVDTTVDLASFVVLAAGEYGGELELLAETTATEVHCGQWSGRAEVNSRRGICCASFRSRAGDGAVVVETGLALPGSGLPDSDMDRPVCSGQAAAVVDRAGEGMDDPPGRCRWRDRLPGVARTLG